LLHSFLAGADFQNPIAPEASLTICPDGTLYGTGSGYYEGNMNGGTVFSLTF
jgi:hypothetical protein